MKKFKLPFALLLSLTLLVSCGDDDEGPKEPTYIIVNNGNGGVGEISDTEDEEFLDIAQAIPSDENKDYTSNTPIIFFLNDKVYLNSITDNFTVKVNGEVVGGTISVNESANGYAVITFIPSNVFSPNSEVTVTLSEGIQDDGGNGFFEDYILSFNTNNEVGTPFNDNTSFEQGSAGVFFDGDGIIFTSSQGCVSATDGSNFASISTGTSIVSSNSATGGTTSLVTLGPINNSLSSISFDYNFISAEFHEFVGSEFDDSFIMIVYGPKGAYTEFVTSVNDIGNNNQQCDNFPNMPDDGDAYAGTTDWITKTANFASVGQPAYVVFTVTDVQDQIYSSIVSIDNISF